MICASRQEQSQADHQDDLANEDREIENGKIDINLGQVGVKNEIPHTQSEQKNRAQRAQETLAG
jgi:hypothetical protein